MHVRGRRAHLHAGSRDATGDEGLRHGVALQRPRRRGDAPGVSREVHQRQPRRRRAPSQRSVREGRCRTMRIGRHNAGSQGGRGAVRGVRRWVLAAQGRRGRRVRGP